MNRLLKNVIKENIKRELGVLTLQLELKMNRLLGNVIKQNIKRELGALKLQLELRPLLTVELLNNKDFDALNERQREYISNCYGYKYGMKWLKNGLCDERDLFLKNQVMEQYEQDIKVSIAQLKKQKINKQCVKENQEQINDLKQLKDNCSSVRVIKEIQKDIDILSTDNNPIQSTTTRVYSNRCLFDTWNDNSVRASLKKMLFMTDMQRIDNDLFELEDILLRTKFTDRQLKSLYFTMNNMSIQDYHKDLDCAIVKIVKGLNNYKLTIKKDIIDCNLFLLD